MFFVYLFECFILAELYKLMVKTVCKLAYKQVLVAICAGSKASKALKGFYRFLLVVTNDGFLFIFLRTSTNFHSKTHFLSHFFSYDLLF